LYSLIVDGSSGVGYFVGAEDPDLSGTFYFLGTNTVVTWFDWGPNQPEVVKNGNDENVLAYYNHNGWHWHDAGYYYNMGYICEIDM